jgi:hypothetical protein
MASCAIGNGGAVRDVVETTGMEGGSFRSDDGF